MTVDINPEFSPDFCIDAREFLSVWDGRQPDFLWASPPCIEFSKSSMPWYGFKKPEWWAMELMFATIRIVHALRPKLWILENVRGAQKWIGKAPFHAGSFYLWGYFPFEDLRKRIPRSPSLASKNRLFPSEDRAARRAKIPEELSYAVFRVVEKHVTSCKEESLTYLTLPLLQGVSK